MKLTRKDYPPKWRAIALRIKNKANWKCQKCKVEHNPVKGIQLGVHHKDGNPMNSSDSNLIALCRKCHLMEQMKLETYKLRKAKEELGQGALYTPGEIDPQNLLE